MKLVQLTIGFNVNGEARHNMHTVCEKVTDVLNVEAYTAIPCLGMWRGEAEDSARIEIVAEETEARTILANVPYLAYALEQCEIMTHFEGSYDFVEAHKPELATIAA